MQRHWFRIGVIVIIGVGVFFWEGSGKATFTSPILWIWIALFVLMEKLESIASKLEEVESKLEDVESEYRF